MIPAIGRPPVALYSGDKMTREEYHRLYVQTPEDFKAELIGGIVYVASPVNLSHGEPNSLLGAVLPHIQVGHLGFAQATTPPSCLAMKVNRNLICFCESCPNTAGKPP